MKGDPGSPLSPIKKDVNQVEPIECVPISLKYCSNPGNYNIFYFDVTENNMNIKHVQTPASLDEQVQYMRHAIEGHSLKERTEEVPFPEDSVWSAQRHLI